MIWAWDSHVCSIVFRARTDKVNRNAIREFPPESIVRGRRPEAPTHALSTSEQTPVQYQHSPLPAAFNTAGNEQLFQLYDFAAEHQTAAVDSDG